MASVSGHRGRRRHVGPFLLRTFGAGLDQMRRNRDMRVRASRDPDVKRTGWQGSGCAQYLPGTRACGAVRPPGGLRDGNRRLAVVALVAGVGGGTCHDFGGHKSRRSGSRVTSSHDKCRVTPQAAHQ